LSPKRSVKLSNFKDKLKVNNYDNIPNNNTCYCLHRPYYDHPASDRERRGYGGSFWWWLQPNAFWQYRVFDVFVQSNNIGGNHLYANIPGTGLYFRSQYEKFDNDRRKSTHRTADCTSNARRKPSTQGGNATACKTVSDRIKSETLQSHVPKWWNLVDTLS
jgi:hypothetical protein